MSILTGHCPEAAEPATSGWDLETGALLALAEGFAAAAPAWTDRLPAHDFERTGQRILSIDRYDVWLLRWPPSTAVSPHDHGDSAGAFVVVSGQLTELRWVDGLPVSREVGPGEGVVVEQGVVHDVISPCDASLSVHLYSPPLTAMSYFDDRARAVVWSEAVTDAPFFVPPSASDPVPAPGVERMLVSARRRIAPRVKPDELGRVVAQGALVVDTRPAALRARDGDLPGAVVVERNVLEWRLDPRSSHRLSEAADPHRPVVIVCDEGYASSLAAAALIDLGRTSVTDLEGGYQAWASYDHKPAADLRAGTSPLLRPPLRYR